MSPETGGRPIRTLHRNLLLQVNDLPVDPPAENAPVKSQRRNKKSTKPVSTIEQTQNHETSESDEEEEGPRYWLRIPRETQRDENAVPYLLTCETQNHLEQIRAYLEETVRVEPASERESVIEEEQGQNESEPCADEPQPHNEQELSQANEPEREIQETQPETQPTLRRSTRDRRPGQMLTYTSLGQPTYQPCLIVSAIGTQPTVYTHQYPQPYFHPFQPTPIIPPTYLSVTYPIHYY